MKRLHC